MSKKTKASVVKGILSYVAQGNTVSATSKKFKISPSGINGMVNGITHTDVTGLDKNSPKKGLTYIRKHKNDFVKSTDLVMARKNKKEPTKTITSSPNTKIQKPNTKVIVDSSNVNDAITTLTAQASGVVDTINSRLDEMYAEINILKSQRDKISSLYLSK